MVSDPKPTNPPNRCDVVANGTTTQRSPPIKMSRFLDEKTAAEQIQRTADYARDPQTYLESTLGSAVVEERKDLLCIPDKVDKDIYGTGEQKTHVQQHIAKLVGKEHGLFFITGVQAQLAAMKIHCENASNNRVAWHVTSHLESAEEGAYKELYGLERTLLGSKDDALPTVEEVKSVLSLPPSQRPAAILVEIPNRVLGCVTYSFSELEEISSACREAGVKFHCDGARLWEIEPYYLRNYGKSFADIGQLFDSVYVSFYKGLRGATGAVLVSDSEAFVKEARMWQRRAGGNAFTLAYEVIDCERGYNENIGTFNAKWKKMAEIVDEITAATADFKTGEGKRIIGFIPEKAMCCQIRTAFEGFTIDELTAARDRVEQKQNVRVFEKIWPKKTLDEQSKTERKKVAAAKAESVEGNGGPEATAATATATEDEEDDDRRYIVEWMVVSALLEVETKVCVDAYVALCEELVAG